MTPNVDLQILTVEDPSMEISSATTRDPRHILQQIEVSDETDDLILILDHPVNNPVIDSDNPIITGFRLKMDYTTLRKKILEAEGENFRLQSQNSNADKIIDELKATIIEQENQLKAKDDLIGDLRFSIDELNREFLKKVEEVGDLLFRVEMTDYEKIRAVERVKELQSEVGINEAMLETEQSLVMRLRKEVDAEKMENNKLTAAFEESSNSMNAQWAEVERNLSNHIIDLAASLNKAVADINKLNRQIVVERQDSLQILLQQLGYSTADKSWLLQILQDLQNKLNSCGACRNSVMLNWHGPPPPPPRSSIPVMEPYHQQ